MSGRYLVLGAVVVAAVAVALVVMVRRDDRAVVPAPTPTPTPPRVVAVAEIDAVLARDADADAPRSALTTLRSSGSGHESWDDQATQLLDAFDAASHTQIECYIAGCAATFTFASDERYRDAAAKLLDSDAYRAWTGGKTLTEPEHRGGQVIVTLLLYRPD